METAPGKNRHETWETYARAWKESSPESKAAALRKSVVTGCLYRDPNTVTRGHKELIDYMLAFHQQVPGGYFSTTWFNTHHDASVAKWNMLDGSHLVIGEGVSYAQYDEEGKLVTMTGFFETPPAT